MWNTIGKLAAEFVKSLKGKSHAQPVSAEEYKEFTFIFNADTVRVMEELQHHYGLKSRPEVIKLALAFLKLATEAESSRERLCIVFPDGSYQAINLGRIAKEVLD